MTTRMLRIVFVGLVLLGATASTAEALRCRLSCVGSLCKRVCAPAAPDPDPPSVVCVIKRGYLICR